MCATAVARTKRLRGVQVALLLLLIHGSRRMLADDRPANTLLQQGRVEDAAAMLQQTLAFDSGDALAHQLLCRVFYAQEMADAAVRECELAVMNAPADSEDEMWLGRAYGMKASHSSPFTALSVAKKVHLSFERAVELNPLNVAAMSDLGEYYVAAPAIVGGGLDKAEVLARKMLPRYPSQSHRLLALVAEKRRDTTIAEAEFKDAVSAGRSPGAYIDLGHFYRRQNRLDAVLPTLEAGIDLDRRKDATLVDAASILSAGHLYPQVAENLLRTYLSSPAKSDDAPAFKVHLQLGQLLAQGGDSAGAHREFAAAFALAPNYAPARKAMQAA